MLQPTAPVRASAGGQSQSLSMWGKELLNDTSPRTSSTSSIWSFRHHGAENSHPNCVQSEFLTNRKLEIINDYIILLQDLAQNFLSKWFATWKTKIDRVSKEGEDLCCNEGFAIKSVKNEHTLPNSGTHLPSVISWTGRLFRWWGRVGLKPRPLMSGLERCHFPSQWLHTWTLRGLASHMHLHPSCPHSRETDGQSQSPRIKLLARSNWQLSRSSETSWFRWATSGCRVMPSGGWEEI